MSSLSSMLADRRRIGDAVNPSADITLSLDLNADMGESFGVYEYGADLALLEVITSANIACGFHAGDPGTMRTSVERAVDHGVRIGAHVGLPDRLGFGRRRMEISPDDAYSYSLYQLAALDGFVNAAGVRMHHFKPHGALYMAACEDAELAQALIKAVADHDRDLIVYTLPGSQVEIAAVAEGLVVYREFFADRPYRGSEVVMFGWTYADIGGPQDAATRVEQMLGSPDFAEIQTVCVHSDTRGAPDIGAAVSKVLGGRNLHKERAQHG